MDPSTTFCPNPACPDKGRVGAGNSGIHSQKERRYCCKTCDKPFAATKGTPS
jgi:transposase-like protein